MSFSMFKEAHLVECASQALLFETLFINRNGTESEISSSAVLSHYSAIHRMRFQHESSTESISHLSAAIQIITERLQDPRESCSNGTIGAVASLIIYEVQFLPNQRCLA
jgi:hypothetical protein